MMPILDGQETLKEIQGIEREQNIKKKKEVKIIMITALSKSKNIIEAFYKGSATANIVKSIEKETLFVAMKKLGLNKVIMIYSSSFY